MEKAFKCIVEMYKKGILKDYAIGGAIATIYYTEPFATKDIDIFFIPPEKENVILLTPFYDFLLKKKGFKTFKEYIMIGDIPIQFIPATANLEKEAVEDAIEVKYRNILVRILKPEYLIAIFLKVYRPKDREKLIKLLEQAKINKNFLLNLLKKHKLDKKLDDFMEKYYG